MIGILLATLKEAAPLVNSLQAVKVADTPFETYWFAAKRRWPAGVIIITGMGPAAAATGARHAISVRHVQHLINAGICGALREGLEPGGVYRITTAVSGDTVPSCPEKTVVPLPAGETIPAAWSALPTARLASVAEPVFGGERRIRLATTADLVDMEGHAVLHAAVESGISCTLIKGVSDGAAEGSRNDLHRNLQQVSITVGECLLSGLAQWPRETGSLLHRLSNFVKVEHTIFSLPLLFAGAWLGAGGHTPPLRVLLLVGLAGLGARTLGMAMNRILDRRLDLLNPRTAGRDLPSGRMTAAQGWSVASMGLLVYGVACVALGPVCIRLSPVPAIILTGYSLLKRFTPLCHFGIGLSLALGPLGAYIAVTGSTDLNPAILVLAAFTFLWISGFDIIYALQDLEADRRNGVHSLPAALGHRGALAAAGLVHAVAAVLAVILWRQTGGGLMADVALAVALGAFAAAYNPRLPLPVRFFPVSAIAGIAGALIPILGGLL